MLHSKFGVQFLFCFCSCCRCRWRCVTTKLCNIWTVVSKLSTFKLIYFVATPAGQHWSTPRRPPRPVALLIAQVGNAALTKAATRKMSAIFWLLCQRIHTNMHACMCVCLLLVRCQEQCRVRRPSSPNSLFARMLPIDSFSCLNAEWHQHYCCHNSFASTSSSSSYAQPTTTDVSTYVLS